MLVAWVAGGWVDRHRRKPLLIAADLVRATALLAIPAAALTGHLGLPLLYAVAAIVGVFSVLFTVADHVFITDLVSRKRLLDANGKREAADAIAEITGPALGGALVAWLTAPIAIAVDAASFVVSAFLIGGIRRHERIAVRTDATSFVDDVRWGAHVVWRDRAVRALFLATATLTLCFSFMGSLYTLYALRDLTLTPGELGVVISCGGIGGLFAASVAAPMVRRWGVRRVLIGALLTGGAMQIFVPLAPPEPVIAMGFLIRGRSVDGLSHQRGNAPPAAAAGGCARARGGDVECGDGPANADRRARRRRTVGNDRHAPHAVAARRRRGARGIMADARAPRVARALVNYGCRKPSPSMGGLGWGWVCNGGYSPTPIPTFPLKGKESIRDQRSWARVRAAFFAAAERCEGVRLLAADFACRESAARLAALLPSRLSAWVMARDRVREGGFAFLPTATSLLACLRVSAEAVPVFGGGSFTPARRALESPIAIACLVERAPCLPSRMCSISSLTNSPACVLGDLPSRLSFSAFSNVFFSGMMSPCNEDNE